MNASDVTKTVLRWVRNILITVIVLAVVAVGGYYLLPPKATATKTFTVTRPAETAFVFLASTPPGTNLVPTGVAQTDILSPEANVVQADIALGDGQKGKATFKISPNGEGAKIELKLEQPLGTSPMERIQALTGGKVKPLVEEAANSIAKQIDKLKTTSFKELQYTVVQLQAQPFFYIENCTSKESRDITSIIAQAVSAIPPLMRTNKLQQEGPLMAVEPKVVQGQYCFQVGYRFTGAKPNALLLGKFGDSPSGTALKMIFAGSEERVVPEVYDRVDALLAASRLDDPSRTDDDWTTFEVYNDDPTQAGGSHLREIYYVVPQNADLTRLKEIAPPKEGTMGAPAAPPAADTPAPAPASASASSESTSQSAAPASAPAPAPAPAAQPPAAAPASAAPAAEKTT